MIAFSECSQMDCIVVGNGTVFAHKKFWNAQFCCRAIFAKTSLLKVCKSLPLKTSNAKKMLYMMGANITQPWVFGWRADQSVWCLPGGIGYCNMPVLLDVFPACTHNKWHLMKCLLYILYSIYVRPLLYTPVWLQIIVSSREIKSTRFLDAKWVWNCPSLFLSFWSQSSHPPRLYEAEPEQWKENLNRARSHGWAWRRCDIAVVSWSCFSK